MGIDITALTTNADKLGECIDKNKKQEQDRKDEQLYGIIERKVKKEEHKREKPRGQDGTLKKCKRLFEKDASPEVLTKLEESLREQEKYYRYYVQCFLPVLDKAIERSKKISNETKERVKQAISEITYNSKYCNQNDRRDSGIESDYSSDAGDDYEKHSISNPNTANEDQEVEKSNEITNSNALLLKAIKNGNNRKFEKYLKDCTDISSIKDEKGNNILHLIVTQLEKKQKFDFLNTVLNVSKKEELKAQLEKAVNDKNGNGQTPLQALLLSKVTKEKHSFETTPRKILTPLKKLIPHYDNTIVSAIQLLKLGANIDDLQLSKEELQDLKEEQKTYYRNFLEKLAESVKKSKLDQKTENSVVIKIAKITDGGYPLHKAVSDKNIDRFNDLLQRGDDITTKNADGDTVLHCAVTLKKEAKCNFTQLILEKNKELVNTRNKQQTPLHRLLQYIEKKSGKQSCTGKNFEKTKRYETLELLLKNGADITVQDKDEKNALHYIASFKGEQKVTCLELILNSVEKEKFSKAANAANEKERTPLQVALITKTTKDKHNLVNPKSRDNTIKFCVKLLQNGVDPKQLILPERLWSKEYYKTIKGIEKSMGRALIPDDMRTELKCNFGRKLKARDIVKYINNVACKAVTTLVFAALACAAIFSASQGIITIATASSIIAVIGVCYLIYLNLENIYEGFGKIKGKFTEEKQLTLQDNAPKNDTQCNNSVKDIENKSNDLEEQEVQKSSNQSECAENPATKMSDISILRQFINKLRWAD